MQMDIHACTHMHTQHSGLSLSVDCLLPGWKLWGRRRVRHEKGGCAEPLCHQASKTTREETHQALRNEQKGTAVIKEGFN